MADILFIIAAILAVLTFTFWVLSDLASGMMTPQQTDSEWERRWMRFAIISFILTIVMFAIVLIYVTVTGEEITGLQRFLMLSIV